MENGASSTSTTPKYHPRAYWGGLVSGDLSLAQVGHPQLGAYNRLAYWFRLRALRKGLKLMAMNWHNIKIFEGGFGVGFYLQYWSTRGVKRVAGLDLSKQAVSAAQRRWPEYELYEADLSAQQAIVATDYDLCTAIDVLYHIVDDTLWRQALVNLCSAVRPGGYLLFTDKFPKDEVFQAVAHVRRRPLAMYREVLASQGFEIKVILPVMILLDDPITCGERPVLGQISNLQWRISQRVIRAFGRWPRVRDAVAYLITGCLWIPELLGTFLLSRVPNLEMVVARKND